MQPGTFFLGFIMMMGASKNQYMVPAPGSSCNADVLRRRISISVCYLFMTMVCSALSTVFVRVLVEAEADARSRALRTWRHANRKVVKKEFKHGIACIAGWKGKVVRPCFCLAIAFSFGSWICVVVTLYLSQKLQAGCVNGSLEIILFAVVGAIAMLVHGFLGWVAITKD